MKKIVCSVVFFGFFINGLAQASESQRVDGNKYLKYCNTYLEVLADPESAERDGLVEDSYELGTCTAYVDSFFATVVTTQLQHEFLARIRDDSWRRTYGEKPFTSFCIPEEVTMEQMVRAGIKYMEENPAELHLPASALLFWASEEAFPCTAE